MTLVAEKSSSDKGSESGEDKAFAPTVWRGCTLFPRPSPGTIDLRIDGYAPSAIAVLNRLVANALSTYERMLPEG
jgi:hypothetical protein